MLLLAEGLFRLDVLVAGDTLRTVVRNLSDGDLEMERSVAAGGGTSAVSGEAATYEPGRATVAFALGAGMDRVIVRTTLATLRYAKRGTVRVTAQAIVRRAPRAD